MTARVRVRFPRYGDWGDFAGDDVFEQFLQSLPGQRSWQVEPILPSRGDSAFGWTADARGADGTIASIGLIADVDLDPGSDAPPTRLDFELGADLVWDDPPEDPKGFRDRAAGWAMVGTTLGLPAIAGFALHSHVGWLLAAIVAAVVFAATFAAFLWQASRSARRRARHLALRPQPDGRARFHREVWRAVEEFERFRLRERRPARLRQG